MSETVAGQRPSPRKKPRQARSAETVGIIIEAAARILEAGGTGAFTTNAVAERAGVSIGSLYQYFPGKAAILGALILRETSALIADADASLAASTGFTALSIFIRSAVAHQLRRPALARLLDLEEARLPADPDTQHVTRRLHELLMEILDRADLPRQADPETAAHDLFAIVKAMVDAAGQRGETDPVALSSRVGRAVHGYLHHPN